ncbi:hypothetical protein B0H14DRAFT_2342711 [Mycena olivaceomarginata]|nr:hypothetical protein B0H14DRAFT_2342711 [Mycena olivaceomarginata]
MVIQLAKQAGMKVIASAGSEEKVKFMQSIGADAAFNYKTTDTRAVLEKEGPIDVYVHPSFCLFSFSTPSIATADIYMMTTECGMISGYNTGHQGIKNLFFVGSKSLHMHGILVPRLQPKYDKEFYDTIPARLASGEIKYTEEISKGLDTVGDVILGVQKGTNKAKAVIVVAEE